jgi:hypothetical protein
VQVEVEPVSASNRYSALPFVSVSIGPAELDVTARPAGSGVTTADAVVLAVGVADFW